MSFTLNQKRELGIFDLTKYVMASSRSHHQEEASLDSRFFFFFFFFFRFHRMPETSKVEIDAINLEGEAIQWFDRFEACR
jgi:hypothetical protein